MFLKVYVRENKLLRPEASPIHPLMIPMPCNMPVTMNCCLSSIFISYYTFAKAFNLFIFNWWVVPTSNTKFVLFPIKSITFTTTTSCSKMFIPFIYLYDSTDIQ